MIHNWNGIKITQERLASQLEEIEDTEDAKSSPSISNPAQANAYDVGQGDSRENSWAISKAKLISWAKKAARKGAKYIRRESKRSFNEKA